MQRLICFPILFMASICCRAQIQVSQEPRHHKVFENAWVRVLDVHIPPGDTSLIHIHSTPSVFLILSNTKTGSQVIAETDNPPHFTDGNIWFEGFYTKPRIHRVWNSDTTEFHVIDMELPAQKHRSIDTPLHLPFLSLLFDEIPVRGYRLTLRAKSALQIPERKAPIILIGLSNTSGTVTVNNKSFVKRGDYVFIKPGNDINFSNDGDTDQSFGLFELK